MIVRRIALNGWRNYAFAAAEFSPGTNVITGENAQGKTNLLEAVYLLTGGKSFRTLFRQMPNPALFDEIPDLAYLYRIEVEIRFPADDTALGFLFLIIGQRER